MTKFQEDQLWEMSQALNRSSKLRNEYNIIFNELKENDSFINLPHFDKMEKAYNLALKNIKEKDENL